MFNDSDNEMQAKEHNVLIIRIIIQIITLTAMVVGVILAIIGGKPIIELVLSILIVLASGGVMLIDIYLKDNKNAIMTIIVIAVWMLNAMAVSAAI